jgi:BlaI family transcriptional regulator, penicillinase repressor
MRTAQDHQTGVEMGSKPEETLSRRERQIMDVVYARGEATAVDVLGGLPDPPTKTAVRTLLRILEEKGHLTHRQDGLTYVYRASRPRGRAGRSALQRVLQTFFDGSLEKAVAAHLGDAATELSSDELNRLADIIDQARRKGK